MNNKLSLLAVELYDTIMAIEAESLHEVKDWLNNTIIGDLEKLDFENFPDCMDVWRLNELAREVVGNPDDNKSAFKAELRGHIKAFNAFANFMYHK